MPCMAHTLQLVIKKIYGEEYDGVISKARKLVGQLRKSSEAVQALLKKTGKTVITDNSTRWNSTYMMIRRLIEVKSTVKEIASDKDITIIKATEWSKFEELCYLLEPFWHQTNILQSDSTSLSLAIPSILELVCHLTNFKQQKQTARAAKAMLDDLEKRFASILNPTLSTFNPLPAAACLCNPQVVGIIIAEQPILLEAAKKFVAEEICSKVHLNRSNK